MPILVYLLICIRSFSSTRKSFAVIAAAACGKYCEDIATSKRRAYRDWIYWAKPVPSFGDEKARVLILGLAPGAHGSNRTGRPFTGDGSGDFLYPVLHDAGFASQPTSVSRGDGMKLPDCWISSVVRCAPPDNTPKRSELRTVRLTSTRRSRC